MPHAYANWVGELRIVLKAIGLIARSAVTVFIAILFGVGQLAWRRSRASTPGSEFAVACPQELLFVVVNRLPTFTWVQVLILPHEPAFPISETASIRWKVTPQTETIAFDRPNHATDGFCSKRCFIEIETASPGDRREMDGAVSFAAYALRESGVAADSNESRIPGQTA